MEHKSLALADCEIKFAATEGNFTGYGSVFGNLDSKNDIIMPGAYDEVLKSGDPVGVYVNHGWIRGELPIGSWAGLKQDARGLFGEANLVMQMPTALNAYWAMKSGLINGLSVAIIPDHKSVERKGDGSRVIHNIKTLKEISIVTDPANDSSRVVSVKFRDELDACDSERDIEQLLRDAGLSKWESKAVISRAKTIFTGRDAPEVLEAKSMTMILDRIKKISQ
ncbi:MAG: HK97 family phage prohead protease [Janthinobacterium lividum]